MGQINAAFKYTFPIAKAERRSDGLYITGYASGPEVDLENERMSPELIQRFSEQINTSDIKLSYRDAHAPDGVLRDLGDITKAWVNEHFHLGIEVKLDEMNPASQYLFKQIDEKGKQYGMSVAGHVGDYSDDLVEGTVVRTYKDVTLDEISNTTRPAWYPSFGTVLSKSIKDASAAASGDNSLENDELLDENVVEDAQKSESVETTDETTQKTDEAAESTDETTEKAAEETTDEDVEKSGRKVSGATATKLLGLYNAMGEELANLGVIEAPATETTSEKSASTDGEENVEKTDGDVSTETVITKSDLDALAEDLRKANERIAELESAPRTQLPGLITDETKKTASEIEEVLAKASPAERMRLAFALQTQGK